MRQLDLFGSLFDTPAPEEKPVEAKPVAAKKKEKEEGKDAGEPYSVVGLAKELLANTDINDLAVAPPNSKNRDDEAVKSLLLFDGVDSVAEDRLQESEVPEAHQMDPSIDRDDHQTSFTSHSVFDVEVENASAVEPAFEEDDEPIVIADVDFESENTGEQVSTAVTEIPALQEQQEHSIETNETISEVSPAPAELKPATKKSKATKEETSSIIFTDGKITVKLKNKPGVGPVITKEKKEKPQRLPQKRGRKSFKEIDAEVDLVEVPEDEILFQKQYYPISEVAKWFRVNTSLLRFWENEFDVLKPRKNRKGDRLFRPEDVKNLQLIYQLLRQRKYTIEGAKEYIKTNKRKADMQLQLTQTLQKFKGFLLDLKANLQP